jgi:hypothetical protein
VPEFHVVPLLAVDVWAIESVFTHMMESPTRTLTGLGTNAVVVSDIAPTGMVTFVVVPEEVPVDPVVVAPVVLGAGVELELLLLHAAAARTTAAMSTRRITIRAPFRKRVRATSRKHAAENARDSKRHSGPLTPAGLRKLKYHYVARKRVRLQPTTRHPISRTHDRSGLGVGADRSGILMSFR